MIILLCVKKNCAIFIYCVKCSSYHRLFKTSIASCLCLLELFSMMMKFIKKIFISFVKN